MKYPSDLSKAALYEQLAEEAIELAHAAQKMARIERGENPTPVTREFVRHNIVEEFNDVLNSIELLKIEADPDIQREKMRRWIERLNYSP